MKNEKKATSRDFVMAIRRWLRRDIVGISRIEENGKVEFRLPNGQTFKISVEEM